MSKRPKIKTLFIASAFLTIFILTVFYILPRSKSALSLQAEHNSSSKSLPLSNDTDTPKDQVPTTSQTSATMPAPIRSSDPHALQLYEQGLKLYYQRHFPQAIDLFNEAITIDPQCYEALNSKGAALAFQGNYDQGLALIQQALDLNPSYVYGNFNRGLAFELAGRWDEAIKAYQKTLQLDNRDTWSYYGIASIYGRQGNIDKVLEFLKPAIALDPDVKEVAREENDFAPVRGNPSFQDLIRP